MNKQKFLEKDYNITLSANTIRDEKLNGRNTIFFGEICVHAFELGYLDLNNEDLEVIANEYNVKSKTVNDWIKILEKNNYISVEIVDNVKRLKVLKF